MESYKLAVKFFVKDASAISAGVFLPIFQGWIREHAIKDHLLIDVADYAHVPEGPGTVLVSSEANYYSDQGENRLGLLYVRKQPIAGADTFRDRLRAVVKSALQAAALLENDPTLQGRLQFRTDEVRFRINDRLLGPNTAETFAALKFDVQSLFSTLYAGATVELSHQPNPETLFEVQIRASQSPPVRTLLDRIATA